MSDAIASLPVRRPTSVAGLCTIVSEQRAKNHAVLPVGGRTLLTDRPLPKPGVAVDMTGLNRVVDYPARDMTVTVQAGLTISALQQMLARENQWLPIDVPLPERATIGGSLAMNVSGPRRFGSGTLRDYAIGISVVSDDGVEVKGGGRVVKNVAGYDLMKLHIGAAGTLGIITQVTLKVLPKPETTAALTFGVPAAELGPVLDLLHASPSRPTAVEVTNQESAWTLAVGFAEKATTVNWQLATLKAELKGTSATGMMELHDAAVEDLWRRLTDLQVRPESTVIGKQSVRPSRTAAALAMHAAAGRLVHAHGLNGIVWVHAEAPFAVEDGTLVVHRGPATARPETPAVALIKHVKQTLDPDGVFNT